MSVYISPDSAALMRDAAQGILALSRQAVDARGVAPLALSGGNTPRALYRLMASPEFAARFDWPHIHLWWSDERCVPLDSPELNYNMADEELIRRVPITSGNVHRTPVERPVAAAADAYEEAIVRALGGKRPASGEPDPTTPAFDVILLGLGDDGHTASLFPGTVGNLAPQRLVVGHYVAQVKMWRITFTPHLINAARHVIFLVSGAGKADVAERVLHGPYQPDVLPAQTVMPTPGDLTWMLDAGAASKLPPR